MPGRKYAATTKYRYGFNGKENDNEVKGEGNQQDYGMRIYDPRLVRFLSVDPISRSYPWYSPYQFAGNSPIFNIDLDGAEPVPGDPNYGRNLIFGSKKVSEVVMPTERNENNENWLAYRAKTLDDVRLQTSNFKSAGIRIKNVYIQAHGFNAGLAVVNLSDGVTDIADPDNYMGATNLNSGDLRYYLELQSKISSPDSKISNEAKEDLSSGFDKLKLKAIEDLKAIADNIENGGNLILAGCHTASGQEGSDFLKLVSDLTGNRFNVIGSEDFVMDIILRTTTTSSNGITVKTMKELFLDNGRSGSWFDRGWKKVVPGSPSTTSTNKDLQLNSKGDPVSDVPTK